MIKPRLPFPSSISLRALAAGLILTMALLLIGNLVTYLLLFRDLDEPGINYYLPVVLTDTAFVFLAQFCGSFLAARLAPSHPVSNAMATCLPCFVGACIGGYLNYGNVPRWSCPLQAAVVLLAALFAGGAWRLLAMRAATE